MTHRTSLLSATFFAMAPFAAIAGNLNEPVVQVAPAPVVMVAPAAVGNWDGFYLGGQIGTGDVRSDEADIVTDTDYDTYGIHAGYMRDLGSFVLGGELSWDKIDLNDNADDVDASITNLKVRAGYDAGRFLPYVTAGFSSLSVDDAGSSETASGIVYGLGAAYAVTDNFILGGEYVRNTFDEDGVDYYLDQFSLRASYKF